MTKQKAEAFQNRSELVKSKRKETTACCDDLIVFIMKDKHHEFSLDLKTLLDCLRYAEEQGAVPELPDGWWLQVNY